MRGRPIASLPWHAIGIVPTVAIVIVITTAAAAGIAMDTGGICPMCHSSPLALVTTAFTGTDLATAGITATTDGAHFWPCLAVSGACQQTNEGVRK